MPSGVIFGLALALTCALATSVSFLLKQRGAVSAPPVRVRHPLRSAAGLFRSRWFAVGWLVALAAWALHVGALALAPLSVVQAVLSAGLVFLALSPGGHPSASCRSMRVFRAGCERLSQSAGVFAQRRTSGVF
jgi:hypothetical protein